MFFPCVLCFFFYMKIFKDSLLILKYIHLFSKTYKRCKKQLKKLMNIRDINKVFPWFNV